MSNYNMSVWILVEYDIFSHSTRLDWATYACRQVIHV